MIWYFLVGLLVILVIFIVFKVVIVNKRRSDVYNKLLALSKEAEVNLISKNKDTFILEKDDKKVLIEVLAIPSNSSVTINSKSTWCLRWGGKRYGRGYPNQRYLNEISDFLKQKSDYSKVIMLYKNTEKILMYLNESEIATVNEASTVYDYKVVTYENLEKTFPLLF